MPKTSPVLQLYPVHLENEKFNVTVKNLNQGNQYLNVACSLPCSQSLKQSLKKPTNKPRSSQFTS